MFLAQLSPHQQGAFLELASQLIAIDGEVHPDELIMLSNMAMRAEDWVPELVLPIAALILVFDDHRSQVAALMELIGLAYADTVYGPEEREVIADIAHRMGISTARMATMEGWVARQLALSAEGMTLLEAD